MTNKDIDLSKLGLGDDFDAKAAAKQAPPKLSQMEIEAANAERNREVRAIQDNVLARQEQIRSMDAKQERERAANKTAEAAADIFSAIHASLGGWLLCYYFLYDITLLDQSTGDRFVNEQLANNRICGLIFGGALFIAGTIKVNLTRLFGRLRG